jgi:hypothetical protein
MAPRSLLPTLSALSDDLARVRAEMLPWDAAVPARRTLPAGGTVEAWYLAGFFLRMWANSIARAEWKKTMKEGPRAASTNGETDQTPRRRPADTLATALAEDKTLDPYLADHVGLLAKSLINPSPDSRSAGGLVRAAVEAHEWCVLLAVLNDVQRQTVYRVARTTLTGFRDSVGALSRSVREFGFSLSPGEHAYAAELLTNYRNSTLAFSWMPYCQGDSDSDIQDPLFPTNRELAVIREFAERVSKEFEGIDGLRNSSVRAVIERIAEAILQGGYSQFADSIASPGLFASQDLAAPGLPINVIPGGHSGQCAPLLVAVAKAGRKSGLSKIIPKVRKHLLDCEGFTQAVIIVSDEWKPGILGDSLGDLKSHVAKGKKIVFLLAPQPGSGIVHMPISLT